MSRRKNSTYTGQNNHPIHVLARYKRVHALDSAVHHPLKLKINCLDQLTENFIKIQHFALCTGNAKKNLILRSCCKNKGHIHTFAEPGPEAAS
jgi:hypothetical protein